MRRWLSRRARAHRRYVDALWLLALGLLALPSSARAYTWMIRHGQTECASCHADPSGGELLTRHGRAEGWVLLPTDYRRDPGPAAEQASAPRAKPRSGFLWGLWDTPSWLLLGGAFRVAGFKQHDFRVFPMQLDLYGQVKLGIFRAAGSLGLAKVRSNSEHARPAFLTRNPGDQLNLLSRSHWLALDLGRAYTLRAGRLHLPFGLRVPEHYLWTRDASRTDRDSDQQHGVALAYNGGGLRGELMAIAGNYQIRPDRYRERGYSGYAELALADWIAVGVSSLTTVARADRYVLEQERTTRGAHGAFLRAAIVKPLVVLAEFDLLHTSRRALGYTGFVQLDYEVIRGVHLLGTAELLDRGRRHAPKGARRWSEVPGEGAARAGGWLTLDWFFLPQLEARVDLVARQDSGLYLLAQLHGYL